MKLLTFLGINDYKETTYCLDDRSLSTRYCPAAMVHFFRPETTCVVVTDQAHAKHFEALNEEIGALSELTPALIPDGHSEADLWTMFDVLMRQVEVDETLIIDVTNGFRSVPFLSLLAVAYLRVVRKINVQGIYYGAYEARDLEANRTPIFNLTPFVTLLDWTTATDQFIETGDGRRLAGLMEKADLSRSASEAAARISNIATALFITSPQYAAKNSRLLDITLKKAELELSQKLPPFGLLAERIRQTYASFGAENLLQDPSQLAQDLRIQQRMISWYIDNQHIPQGLTLAREWLVTLTAYSIGQESVLKGKDVRKPVEDALNAFMKRDGGLPPEEIWPAEWEPLVQALPAAKQLVDLWRDVTRLRNPVDHAFHEKTPRKPRDFIEETRLLLPRIGEIANLMLGGSS